MEKRISARTGLLGLVGSPVSHSGSPAMYNFSFAHDGLDYVYLAFDVKPDDMPRALDAIRLFNMRGCNVTMPCKTVAAALVDELSPAARIVGAVNTIVNDDGRLTGHITDGLGFVRNLREEGVDVAGKRLTILGAGGAATAVQVQCALDGARELAIFNATDAFLDRAKETAARLKKERPDCRVSVHPLEDRTVLRRETDAADILVNATSVGMAPHADASLVDKGWLRKDLVVADTIYDPEKTLLIRDAEAAGCQAIGGKGMLLWQGVAAYRLYFGRDMPAREYQKFQAENNG